MRPDLLITWIRHTDYPIFRYILRKYRDFFGEVFIYFSEHYRDIYFDDFLKEAMAKDRVTFIEPQPIDHGLEDWRNKATNIMLDASKSEWVCSVEQDWFCKDWDLVLNKIEEKSKDYDLLGWAGKSGAKNFYIHPAFFFISRELLERSRRDFSAKEGEDHFGHITRDVEALGSPIYDLESELDCVVKPEADCFHLGGVNQNYLASHDRKYAFHRWEPFSVYNYWCRKTDVEQSPKFTEESLRVEKLFLDKNPGYDLENNDWTKFFKM